jgi:hypothetical protein
MTIRGSWIGGLKVLSGEEGRKEWERVYFSDTEKLELNQMRLKGENQRLENENNPLLVEIQSKSKRQAVSA